MDYQGFTLTLFLDPLGSDLSFVADKEPKKHKASMSEADDGVTSVTFNASSFSLMNSAMAAATLFSPLFTGWLNQSHGWGAMTAVLGAIVTFWSNTLRELVSLHIWEGNEIGAAVYCKAERRVASRWSRDCRKMDKSVR